MNWERMIEKVGGREEDYGLKTFHVKHRGYFQFYCKQFVSRETLITFNQMIFLFSLSK